MTSRKLSQLRRRNASESKNATLASTDIIITETDPQIAIETVTATDTDNTNRMIMNQTQIKMGTAASGRVIPGTNEATECIDSTGMASMARQAAMSRKGASVST
jgi:hypothetical protein